MILTPRAVEIRHFHLFCGLAGGASGFNRGAARVGHSFAQFTCIGGIDNDPAAIEDFTKRAGVRGTLLDLFSRSQYLAFHGHVPPADWLEATPADIRRAAGNRRPHIVFTSPPCKGYSGLLSESRSKSAKYQALNELAFRGIWLALEAWADDPPEFFLLENVPRIQTRGHDVLEQLQRLFEAYGYATTPSTHDCGELGGLGQRRPRFLLVCRHREKVPPFLYEPPKRPLRSVGDVIWRFPLPGDAAAGPMHRMRALQWRTWVRLAFVEAGSDWRSLKKLNVTEGVLSDYGIVPAREWYRTALGVQRWTDPSNTVTSEARPQNGAFSVADPRPGYTGEFQQLGVNPWDKPVGTVSGQSAPGGGAYSVADPRPPDSWEGHGKYSITPFDAPTNSVIGASATGNGAFAVADPRLGDGPNGPHFNNVYRVIRFDQPSMAVTAGTSPSAGGLSVADPRSGIDRVQGDHYLTARHYGVLPWDGCAQAVTASAGHDNGAFSIADPRCAWSENAHRNKLRVCDWERATPTIIAGTRPDSGALSVADPRCAMVPPTALPAANQRLVAVIRALDGTWHRPFTTLELAALQSLVDPGEYLELHGTSDTAWRERIGNAVPRDAAAAIASVMGEALLLAWAGETFALSATPVWVQPIAIALSVDVPLEGALA
jgi:site-specific DNA-cytosine methylase